MVSKQVQSQTRQPKRSHFIKLHIKVQLLKVLFDTGFSFGTFIDASTASKLIFFEIGTLFSRAIDTYFSISLKGLLYLRTLSSDWCPVRDIIDCS